MTRRSSLVAEILVLHVHEAAREQAGAGEQDDGERRLKDDENLLRQARSGRWVLRLAPRRASTGSACEANHAGAVPKSAPVTRDRAKAKASTARDGVASMGTNFALWKVRATMQLDSEIGDDQTGQSRRGRRGQCFQSGPGG